MKFFPFVITAVMMPSAAMAIGSGNTWEQIFSNPHVFFEPEYQYWNVLSPFDLRNVCLSGSSVKTVTPVSVCLRYEKVKTVTHGKGGGVSFDLVCVEDRKEQVVRSRAFEETRCIAYSRPPGKSGSSECLEYLKESKVLPDSIRVNVTFYHGRTSDVFSKDFRFSVCEGFGSSEDPRD